MNNCIKCGITCLAIGMMVGAIVVAKNKKLASVINDSTNKVTQTFTEVKEDMQDKIEEMKESAQTISNTKKKN